MRPAYALSDDLCGGLAARHALLSALTLALASSSPLGPEYQWAGESEFADMGLTSPSASSTHSMPLTVLGGSPRASDSSSAVMDTSRMALTAASRDGVSGAPPLNASLSSSVDLLHRSGPRRLRTLTASPLDLRSWSTDLAITSLEPIASPTSLEVRNPPDIVSSAVRYAPDSSSTASSPSRTNAPLASRARRVAAALPLDPPHIMVAASSSSEQGILPLSLRRASAPLPPVRRTLIGSISSVMPSGMASTYFNLILCATPLRP